MISAKTFFASITTRTKTILRMGMINEDDLARRSCDICSDGDMRDGANA
jgi:hypothetical protein